MALTPTQRAIESFLNLELPSRRQVEMFLTIVDIVLIDYGNHPEQDRHRDRLINLRQVLASYLEMPSQPTQ